MTLKELKNEIRGDLGSKPTITKFVKGYLYSARFRILLNHRIGKFCYKSGNYILRQIALRYRYKLVTKRGCDISYHADLGKNLRLPHPIGIVIGDGVIIGDDVMIFQQVTFGSHGKIDQEFKYPIIKTGVKIFAGAKVIGGVVVGEDSIIGANTLVNKDVPANSIAYGIPCKIKPK